MDVLDIDNTKVLKAQVERLERSAARRDEAACRAALDAITKASETGEGNLLTLR